MPIVNNDFVDSDSDSEEGSEYNLSDEIFNSFSPTNTSDSIENEEITEPASNTNTKLRKTILLLPACLQNCHWKCSTKVSENRRLYVSVKSSITILLEKDACFVINISMSLTYQLEQQP